jgi:hypothetical protein
MIVDQNDKIKASEKWIKLAEDFKELKLPFVNLQDENNNLREGIKIRDAKIKKLEKNVTFEEQTAKNWKIWPVNTAKKL